MAAGGLGADDPARKHAPERRRVVEGGMGMHVDVVGVTGGACEEELPKRGEWEWGCGEEHEGEFLGGSRTRVHPGGKLK